MRTHSAMMFFACLCALLACALFSGTALAVRPSYGTVTERTVNVDPPGVTCSSTPGSCFKIHYVTSGTHAISTTDSNGNGTPDYVDDVSSVLSEVYTREVVQLGWPAPPSDSVAPSNGGDGRHDVYIVSYGCNIASVDWEGPVSPGSISYYSYTQLDKDMRAQYVSTTCANRGPGNLSTMTQREVIADVIAHEYHHAIQDGMNARSSGLIKEATSNWMNDEAYDALNVNVRSSVLGDFSLFTNPGMSLDDGVSYNGYGGWFWLRYLSERFGHAFIREIWQQLVSEGSTSNMLTAMNDALRARGTTLADAWVDFTGKLFARTWFEEGSTWPDIRPAGVANGTSPFAAYPVTAQTASLNHMARRYVQFNPPTPAAAQRALQILFNGPNAQASGAVAILEMADGRRVDFRLGLDANNDGSYRAAGFSAAAPPTERSARVTSVVLAMANATPTANNLAFAFCGNCSLSGGADPSITPWGAWWGNVQPLWQTIDVWVDNDGDCMPNATGRPGCNEADDPSTPQVDAEPTKNRINTLYARIRNLGDVAANDVTVQLRYIPAGVGVPDSSFAVIGSATVSLAAAGDPSGRDVQVVSVPWDLTDLAFNNGGLWNVPSTPETETISDFDHFCVKVGITHSADVNSTNNEAQNNFGSVPTGGSPRTAKFLVANAEDMKMPGEIQIEPPLPEGWKLEVQGLGRPPYLLKPGELRLVTVTFAGLPLQKPPQEDVIANVSLLLAGERRSGVSFELAKAHPMSPETTKKLAKLHLMWERYSELELSVVRAMANKDRPIDKDLPRMVADFKTLATAANDYAGSDDAKKGDAQVAQSAERLRDALKSFGERLKKLQSPAPAR